MMEISNAYSNVLELEGLLLLLKTEIADNYKVNRLFDRLFDKLEEINADIMAIRQQYGQELGDESELQEEDAALNSPADVLSHDADAIDCNCEMPANQSDSALSECCIKEDCSANQIASDCDSAIADSVLFEETQDAGCDVADVDAVEDNAPEVSDISHDIAVQDDNAAHQRVHDVVPSVNSVNIILDDSGVDVNRSAFAISARGDIKKLFTLNDNYKFRRQLFSNSQQEYAQTLLMIEGMESTFEAEDYFYKTLGWDKENPDVKDFMSIISAYFMGK